MNHLRSHSKKYLLVFVLTLTIGSLLFFAQDTQGNQQPNSEELAQIKNDMFFIGPSRLEELARIKEDLILGNTHINGPSRLEELARIKDDSFSVSVRFNGPSRLEELTRIKEN